MKILKEAERCPETGRRLTYRVIQCGHCKKGEIELSSGWANSCPVCETEYNGSGQMLAPRSQWGEETGEHPADLSRLH